MAAGKYSITSFTLADIYFSVVAQEKGICAILFDHVIEESGYFIRRPVNAPQFFGLHKQLQEYFRGKRTVFDLPLQAAGTEFQVSVWKALLKIPYGQTRSYKEIAEKIKRPKAVRAVGGANGSNPVPIIIPCHRVISHDGTLGGYSAGLDIKTQLLELERKYSAAGR